MRETVGIRIRRRCPGDLGGCLAALVFVAFLNPLPVRGAAALAGSFRSGVCVSQTRPFTPKQETALLMGLRRSSGLADIHFNDEGFLDLGNRLHFVDGSSTARALITAAVDGRDLYVIESHQRSSELAFARIRGSLDYQNLKSAPGLTRRLWNIEIDFYDYTELRGHTEAIRAFDPALNLLHELAHPIMHLRDSTGDGDALGDCERFINQIRRELGLLERESYDPVNRQAVTPYGTGQRILGELSFVRFEPGKRSRKYRLTFDVENVAAASLVEPRSAGVRAVARR
ncbi:MAG: hypothetical protein EHM61_14660 [Acidobacteria bacterium]|nr:MAG: hypothetical protein EHM61_14660 [Acidobacteriota bacterium]